MFIMKSIMYHYIRNQNKSFPFFKAIQKKDYKRQLDYFSKNGFVSSFNEFFTANDKFLLTFDDGIKDHIFAAETLKKYNAIGLFFIPTFPYITNKLLDVHKTHLIISKVKALDVLDELKKYLVKKNINNFYFEKDEIKYKKAYQILDEEFHRKKFKKIMNYYGNLNLKEKILDFLLKKFEINVKPEDYYLKKKEIKYIASLGMIIGSHSESHTLLSRLTYQKQLNEINNSKIFLEKIIKKEINTFCYPYGGKLSYNTDTKKILATLKFKFAFSVEYRDIKLEDIEDKPFELPRYDCNLF